MDSLLSTKHSEIEAIFLMQFSCLLSFVARSRAGAGYQDYKRCFLPKKDCVQKLQGRVMGVNEGHPGATRGKKGGCKVSRRTSRMRTLANKVSGMTRSWLDSEGFSLKTQQE